MAGATTSFIQLPQLSELTITPISDVIINHTHKYPEIQIKRLPEI